MKTAVKLITLIVTLFAMDANAGGINFKQGSWEEIKALARKSNKIIFVDAYASWCGPCKTMTANTFTDEAVAEFYNENFINFKLDMESDAGLAFDEEYSITAYPTLMYINGEGEVVKSHVGFKDAENFLDLGMHILFPHETKLYQLNEQYKNGARDTAFLYSYILELDDAGEDTEIAVKEYFSQIQSEDMFNSNSFVMFYLFVDEIENSFTKYFIQHYADFEAQFGDYAVQKGLDLLEVNTLEAAKNKDEKLFMEVLKTAQHLFPEYAEDLKPEIELIYYYGVE